MASSDSRRSVLMASVRQRDTAPEQAVGRILARLHIRFCTDARDLPGSPDLVNRRARWAIFVHGCFWHAHEGCRKATVPKENRGFWEGKFAANRARDRRREEQLRWLGYRVLVVWECELKNEDALVEHLE